MIWNIGIRVWEYVLGGSKYQIINRISTTMNDSSSITNSASNNSTRRS